MQKQKLLGCSALLGLLLSYGTADAQRTINNRLTAGAGLAYLTMLDRQASPVLYVGSGPAFLLTYERIAATNQWQLEVNGGMLAMQPSDKELRFEDPYFSAQTGGFHLTYLHLIKSYEKSTWKIGASLNEEMLVDMNYEVGRWPYAFAQGGLYAEAQWNYQLSGRHQLGASVALPIVAAITDMPYNQIPRVEGQYPGLASIFKVGTRMPFWNTYQRADIDLAYEFTASSKWRLGARYKWAWLHDQEPKDFWAYNGTLSLNIIRAW